MSTREEKKPGKQNIESIFNDFAKIFQVLGELSSCFEDLDRFSDELVQKLYVLGSHSRWSGGWAFVASYARSTYPVLSLGGLERMMRDVGLWVTRVMLGVKAAMEAMDMAVEDGLDDEGQARYVRGQLVLAEKGRRSKSVSWLVDELSEKLGGLRRALMEAEMYERRLGGVRNVAWGRGKRDGAKAVVELVKARKSAARRGKKSARRGEDVEKRNAPAEN